MRDDFTKATKDALAARSGHYCSFPGCSNVTHGPSDESDMSISSTGMACHISAASAGSSARRYDSSISVEQRRSIDNGLWLCYTHGKLIDADEVRYSISILKKWKDISERKAQLRQEHGDKYNISSDTLHEIGLPEESLTISGTGEENFLIGNLIQDSRVSELWGYEVAHAIRDVSIELVRNAFQHGGATQFQIEINGSSIVLNDNGEDYSLWNLSNETGISGGSIAAKQIIDCLKYRLVVVSKRINKVNSTVLSIINDAEEIFELTPCAIDITWNQLKRSELPFAIHESCRSKCIILPPYFSVSDSFILRDIIPIEDDKPIIFILTETSPLAQEILESKFPDCLSIRLE